MRDSLKKTVAEQRNKNNMQNSNNNIDFLNEEN
jgi:hypothetical protein